MGEQGGFDFLDADTVRELHRSRGDKYALGWFVSRDWRGGTEIRHAGSNGTNFSNVWMAPKKEFAVFICANQGELANHATDNVAGKLIKLRTKWKSAAGR